MPNKPPPGAIIIKGPLKKKLKPGTIIIDGGDILDFPLQSEKGKCVLSIDGKNNLSCTQEAGCKGKCTLFSVPRNDPKAKPKIATQPAVPDPALYYFCQCMG